jgi:hypothetical protein
MDRPGLLFAPVHVVTASAGLKDTLGERSVPAARLRPPDPWPNRMTLPNPWPRVTMPSSPKPLAHFCRSRAPRNYSKDLRASIC